MPRKPARPSDEEIDPRFAPVIAAFAKDPRVGQKRMFGSKAVLNVNGKIFAMVVRGQFVAKLPKPRVDDLVDRGAGVPFDPGHGRLMKEWVALVSDKESWIDLAKEALRFVGGSAAER